MIRDEKKYILSQRLFLCRANQKFYNHEKCYCDSNEF